MKSCTSPTITLKRRLKFRSPWVLWMLSRKWSIPNGKYQSHLFAWMILLKSIFVQPIQKRFDEPGDLFLEFFHNHIWKFSWNFRSYKHGKRRLLPSFSVMKLSTFFLIKSPACEWKSSLRRIARISLCEMTPFRSFRDFYRKIVFSLRDKPHYPDSGETNLVSRTKNHFYRNIISDPADEGRYYR